MGKSIEIPLCEMLKHLIEHFQFLVNLHGISPEKAKKLVDKRFKEVYDRKIPEEFNQWYQLNYSIKIGDT